MRALLVVTSDSASDRFEAESVRDELESLCSSAGIEACAWHYITVRNFNSATYIGKGQLEMLMWSAHENDCDLVVFNNAISPRIQRNLETISGLCIVDRQEVILQIFASRAMTKEARLQVELARLQYSIPRLTRRWVSYSQQRGGVHGNRGSGEKQIELDRRKAEERISRLKKEIAQVARTRETQRKNRVSGNIKNVAVVGYTNSGKSTFLNRISDASVLSRDMLFATLDPTTRRVFMPDGSSVLFTDTVGFVRDLPHELIDSFSSTLEEARMADALVIVLDSSRYDIVQCWNTTREILEKLGAWQKPRIVILNKTDIAPEENIFAISALLSSGEKIIKASILKDDMHYILCAVSESLSNCQLSP